jgi:predicted hydrocarbon binding protein
MANKIERVLKSINDKCGDDIYNDLLTKVGMIGEKATLGKQAKYIKSLLDELSSNYGSEISEKVMRPCGYQCISEKTIKTAKLIYEKSDSIEGFLKLLNENHIGGGYLHLKDNKIIGIYDRCYCGIPRSAKDISPIYCECSAGWFEKLFLSVFEKEVMVKRVDTILNGADKCTFQISF